LDIGVLGYIGIVQHKEHSPEVLHIPPGTPCIHTIFLVFMCLAWASAVYGPQYSVCYFYNHFFYIKWIRIQMLDAKICNWICYLPFKKKTLNIYISLPDLCEVFSLVATVYSSLVCTLTVSVTKHIIYRVFHNLWTLLQEVISSVFVIKKVHINMFDFGRLRSYDRLKHRIEGNDYWQ